MREKQQKKLYSFTMENMFFFAETLLDFEAERENYLTTEMLLKHNSDKFNKNSLAVFHPLLSNISEMLLPLNQKHNEARYEFQFNTEGMNYGL